MLIPFSRQKLDASRSAGPRQHTKGANDGRHRSAEDLQNWWNVVNWAEVERHYVKGHHALGMVLSSICRRT
jgi:hypothetical protein